MQDALIEFEGSAEIELVLLADAELSLARGDVTNSLSVLKSVPATSPLYFRARKQMADIYLNEQHDRIHELFRWTCKAAP